MKFGNEDLLIKFLNEDKKSTDELQETFYFYFSLSI